MGIAGPALAYWLLHRGNRPVCCRAHARAAGGRLSIYTIDNVLDLRFTGMGWETGRLVRMLSDAAAICWPTTSVSAQIRRTD
jgi:hypothetical protein